MKTKLTASIVSLTTTAVLFLGFSVLPAYAQTDVAVSTNTGSKINTKAPTQLSKIITRGDDAMSKRITSLNDLNTRIQELKNVSVAQKSNISTQVQTSISGLTALKAKLDADTTSTVALSDEKTITGSYRIYALVIPQGYILSSADRVNAVSDMLSAVAIKLQARMTADQTAGKDVTALQTSLADMNAKIADAKVQASAAQTRVVSLIPDGGDKTQMSSNTAALKSARADIRVASSDLEAARKDAKSIMSSLKSEKVNTSEKTSASTN